ncbi:Uncharacterised protein [Salmonella enterica]|nr:hypothetical protein AN2351V1_3376 [Citrobacter koseri]CAH6136590.1 hypothetical protein AN2351V1_3376 [Citrobacter koseri]SUF33397.1 Uncharacterised protein [Salmonella enterica]
MKYTPSAQVFLWLLFFSGVYLTYELVVML